MNRYGDYALARTLLWVYALVVVYASLYPLSGWRDTGAPVLGFLNAAWPRYTTGFDMTANALSYLPLGFLAVPALRGRLKPGSAALLAILGSAALSLAMESAQGFLPSRVPSNVDLGFNTVGAVFGAMLGVRYCGMFAEGGGLHRWRARRIAVGKAGDLGLTLLALWLLTQLNPENPPFGTGDFRTVLDLPAPIDYDAERYRDIEIAVSAAGILAVGLIAWRVMHARSAWLLGTLLLLGLACKWLAWALVASPAELMHWLTPGNRLGILVGVALLAGCLGLPESARGVIAPLAVLACTAAVNLTPENPYRLEMLQPWRQGHFLNFYGLTRIVSSAWPFLALAYLVSFPAQRTGR